MKPGTSSAKLHGLKVFLLDTLLNRSGIKSSFAPTVKSALRNTKSSAGLKLQQTKGKN